MPKIKAELPDAEDAKVTQKKYQKRHINLPLARLQSSFEFSFVFSFLRFLRNFCVFCVRYWFSAIQSPKEKPP